MGFRYKYYLTSNQTITLSGDVVGSGITSISTSIGATNVTAKLLTNYVTGTNVAISVSDSILSAFGKTSSTDERKTWDSYIGSHDYAYWFVSVSIIYNQLQVLLRFLIQLDILYLRQLISQT